MIEVIYKEEKQEAKDSGDFISVPRNIRQIGQVQENYRIYIEDYVYTFLVRLSRSEGEGKGQKEGQKGQTAVLTGETKWWSGVSYLFIQGAILVNDMEAASDHIDFTEEVWGRIHEDQGKYFENQEIVGWFFSEPQLPMEMTEIFAKIHLKHFGGEKVLMLMEPQEREDTFFRYENNAMVRQGGYYIYYEKNPQMQSYMIDKKQELQPEVTEKYEDDAVKTFRKIITNKKKEDEAEERPSVFSYAATACLVIAVMAVGANFYHNNRLPDEAGEETAQVSSLIVEEVTPVPPTQAAKKTSAQTAAPTSAAVQTPGVTGIPVEKLHVTGTPREKAAPAPSPAVTPAATGYPEKEAEETSSIYREEADIRKAKRRETVYDSYVIKPGDTLFQISMDRYGSMEVMQEICRLNDLSLEEIIYPGQVIVLP